MARTGESFHKGPPAAAEYMRELRVFQNKRASADARADYGSGQLLGPRAKTRQKMRDREQKTKKKLATDRPKEFETIKEVTGSGAFPKSSSYQMSPRGRPSERPAPVEGAPKPYELWK